MLKLAPLMNRILLLIIFSLNLVSYSQSKSAKDLATEISIKKIELSDLVEFADENINDSIEKAKFIYYWIGLNIEFDDDLTKNKNKISYDKFLKNYSYNKDPELVFERKTAVCYGYSILFQWFMVEFGIKSLVISGHIRDERNQYVELYESDFRHAWNVIELNNRRMIIDTTWGTSNDEELSDFYFDINPERAIITHYPEVSKWQLLENPLTLQEFNESKYIKPIWYLSGFSDNPKFKQEKNHYYFVFRNNPNENWKVSLLFSVDNNKFKSIKKMKSIVQDGYTYFIFERRQLKQKVFFKVNLREYDKNVGYTRTYYDVINFKI